MNLTSLDLNLLVVLDAVLREGSATRAAAELHVTQPAVSNALRRLRAVFGDPLVVRTAHGFEPTPRALALAPELRKLLEGVRTLVTDARAFDPATTTRRFTVACSDAIEITLLPALLARFGAAMPKASLRIVTIDQMIAQGGLGPSEVDLLVGMPPRPLPGCASELAYEDPLVCAVRADHPLAKKRLTAERYATFPHVDVGLFGERDAAIDRACARLGLRRDVLLLVPRFSAVPFALARTDAIATISRRLAEAFAAFTPLRITDAPLDLAPITVRQVWHGRTTRDPGCRALRRLVREAAGADLKSEFK